jgi:hypothetical protein
MREIFVEKRYLVHRNIRKRHIAAFVVLSFVMIALIITDLALFQWFKYCWWDFGLLHARSFTSFSNFNNESGISDVISDACKSLKHLVQRNCPNFCDYVLNFEIGGALMIFFCVFSVLLYLICAIFHIWSFFKAQFKFRRIWIFFVLPCIFYNLGLLSYVLAARFWNIDSTNTHRFDTKDLEIKEGIILAMIIVPLTFLLAAYGLLKTRQEFIEKDGEEGK